MNCWKLNSLRVPVRSFWDYGPVKRSALKKAKQDQWEGMLEEVHKMEVSDPIIAGDYISLMMDNDITMKGQGRIQGKEIAVYEVNDGKIVSEQFFYKMG